MKRIFLEFALCVSLVYYLGAVEGRPETQNPELIQNSKNESIQYGPTITIKSGKIRPKVLSSRSGRNYLAFLGIPYASPPTQNLRFMDPNPFGEWGDEVFNATEFGPRCIQYDLLASEVGGKEDCLHLNVFTPRLPKEGKNDANLLPVMVFIHQGAFMFGYSKDYQGKYLMDEDVVLVTLNYRLGSFGFLNTFGDSDAKGNMGLKDQVMALQWIQDNIKFFGGHKDSVTLFGESAGGASVHYHMLSDMSKGLFSKGISQSGTALSPWAFTRNPRKQAKRLGAMMNCPNTDMEELFTCLQGKDANDIAQKHKEFFEWNTDPISPFAPSREASLDQHGVFLKETPYTLIKKGDIRSPVPWILGLVEQVGLLDAHSILVDKQLVAEMNQDWHRIAPLSFFYRDSALEPDAVSNQIKAFYFGSKAIGNDTAQNLTDLYSDRYFGHSTRVAALMHSRINEANQVYLYYFTYRGKHSHINFIDIHDNEHGVSEGDELQYLFNMDRFDELEKGSRDDEFSKKFIKLWLSFALNGRPTETWNGTEWKSVSSVQVKGDEALMYYRIDEQCKFIDEPFASRMSFWDNLPLNEYNDEMVSVDPYSRDEAGSFLNFDDIIESKSANDFGQPPLLPQSHIIHKYFHILHYKYISPYLIL